MFGGAGGGTAAVQASSLQTSYDQGKTIDLDPADPVVLEVDTDTDTALSINNSSSTETIGFTGEGNINQKGTLHLQGITNDTEQLRVTANASQSATPIGIFEDSANNSSINIYENKVDVTGNDDNEVALTVTGSPNPNEKLFVVRNNAEEEKLSIDKDGQLLVDGLEIESGAGELIVAYAEFDVLNPINTVRFNVADFDDPLIVGYRIELRGLRSSMIGNDPGTLQFIVGIRYSTSTGEFTFTPNSAAYKFNGITFRADTTEQHEGLALNSFPAGPLFGETSNDIVKGALISATIEISNIPEFLKSTMQIRAEGMITSSIGFSTINHTKFINSGVFTNIGESDEDNTIKQIQINCSTSNGVPALPAGDIGFSEGSIKVIGIKKGGPPFTGL